MSQRPFNPLAMTSLAASIVSRLEDMESVPLDDVERFFGAGLYAIYYQGRFGAYRAFCEMDAAIPIYVGKAVPRGGRKGVVTVETGQTRELADRIRQHATSIRAATNLDIADCFVRWLVVDDIWIPLGESALIRRYRPVWNVIVDGFGNHDPGQGRANGMRSRWDTLHPGRSWASRYPARNESPEQIEQELAEYVRSRFS